MKIRKTVFPNALSDWGASLFILIMIPVTYWFELYVVLPTMYEMWSGWYCIHFIFGTFLMANITSNFVAVVITDTSISGEMMPTTMKPKWRFCSVCETVAPPRSWHCNVCNNCILRRDHHCMFTGCCIGHYNYRYFVMFIVYMFIGTLYASYFNSFFLWGNISLHSPMTILKLMFPVAILVFGFDASENQVYLIVFLINLIGTLFTFVLLYVHSDLICKGATTYEKSKSIDEYNNGLKENIKEVMGEKWYVAWFFPFIKSKLPYDGIHWNTKKISDGSDKNK